MPPLFCDTDLARRIERAETKFITASTEAAQRRTGGAGFLIPLAGGVEFGTWLEIVLDAVAHPDTEGLPWLEEFPRDVLENAERDLAAAGARHYLALVDRGPAGAASMGIEDGVRAVQRRDGSRVPPPGCAVRPAGRPGRRRDRGRVRARPRHGSAGATLAAERPAPRVRPALHASHAGALTPGGHHEVSSRWLTPSVTAA